MTVFMYNDRVCVHMFSMFSGYLCTLLLYLYVPYCLTVTVYACTMTVCLN